MSDTSPTRPDSTRPGPTDLASNLTSARLSLGNPSPSVFTADHLRFQLDHAFARDAVHTPLDIVFLQRGLIQRGLQPLTLHSGVDALFTPGAPTAELRRTYLRRPDLGRSLHPESVLELQQIAAHQPTAPDLAIILADGLSSLALERHALPLLDALLPLLPSPYSLVPVVQNARVAIADPIGHILRARLTVLLIGERPGLSSPDSLGCYITWSPRPGRTDAERNCISNIRGDAGLSYVVAALRIAHYIHEAHRLQTTGTALKDPSALSLPPR